MKNQSYYLGLDIGTNSIGYAITDLEYNIIKKNGKSLWGIRLFEQAKTAEERRGFRTARRRYSRRRDRIKLLQELFNEEISKIDFEFFMRLNESKFQLDDKKVSGKFTLFNDSDYTDIDYHKNYKTIYHLRKDLVENPEKHDARLVYLAIHQMMKNRGHFLYEGAGMSSIKGFDEICGEIKVFIDENYDIMPFDFNIIDRSNDIITERGNITAKAENLMNNYAGEPKNKKQNKYLADILAGKKVNLVKMFPDKFTEGEKDVHIQLGQQDLSEIEPIIEKLDEYAYLIEKLSELYNFGLFSAIKGNKDYICQSKVETYEKHQSDLKLLKKIVKKYLSQDKYNEVFKKVKDTKDKNKKSINNYCTYIGKCDKNNCNIFSGEVCSIDDFCKYLKSILGEAYNDAEKNDEEFNKLMSDIDQGTFMPKQKMGDNALIPYQVNLMELKKILENASKYLDFLNNKDEKGITIADKIILIFTFKIPYYVGPLNKNSKFAWIERKPDKIYPWNFDEVVDAEKSAEKFIQRMTNKCSYLVGEDVLPMNSLAYSKYCVLNELNTLKINDKNIDIQTKQLLFDELFVKKYSRIITKKTIEKCLVKNNIIEENDEISGIDDNFKGRLKSYHDFKDILKRTKGEKMVEDIIKSLVVFPSERSIMKKWLVKTYPNVLSKQEVEKILKLKYTGWGRLSEKFLTGIYKTNAKTGETQNIIDALYSTNDNLMMLLGGENDYSSLVSEENSKLNNGENISLQDQINNLPGSPAIRKAVMQILLVVDELVKILGCQPKKIFLEMARGADEVKKRTKPRKAMLEALYKNCKKDSPYYSEELLEKFSKDDNNDLRSKRLFHYYLQMGRCMYTGERIEINDIFNENLYDIDHIYPKSKIYDDSFTNTALVKKSVNAAKGDKYPIDPSIQKSRISFWKYLSQKGFIGKEKYKRLTRTTEFAPDELTGFINRQLVETRQSSKIVSKILEERYENSELIYVKAQCVSTFRQKYDIIKCRSVNDLHHAKDAYLNVVVGNIYNVLFTKDPRNFINEGNHNNYNFENIGKYDVKRGNVVAWLEGGGGSIKTVKKNVYKSDVLFTRVSYCNKDGLYKVTPMSKGKGQVPLKTSDERLHDISKYGGYNSATVSYFALVQHDKVKNTKNKTITKKEFKFVPVLLYLRSKYEDNPIKYCEENLQLDNPEILISKIKINTLMKIDGYYVHLSGKSSDRFIIKIASQLLVGKDNESYIKNLENYCKKLANGERMEYISKFDNLSKENNLKIYNLLVEKLNQPRYSVYIKQKKQKDFFMQSPEKFKGLTIEEQCTVLMNFLNLFKCDASKANLKLVEGKENIGNITQNLAINPAEYTEYKLIHQSISGFFSSEIDILKLFKDRREK